MANLKEIQRKIKSVQNTQKITKAMKLVSTAKLKRAEELMRRSKVYARKLNEIIGEIACQIEQFRVGGVENRYFVQPENVKKVIVLFVTADKGLCGGFNSQTIKFINRLYQEYIDAGLEVSLRAVGRKGIEYFTFKGIPLDQKAIDAGANPSYDKAKELISDSLKSFVNGDVDKVVLVHNGYKNMITQEIKMVDLFPIDTKFTDSRVCKSVFELEANVENNKEEVLDELIKKYAEFNLFYAIIDSLAGEHGARMQAMDTASNNAKKKVGELTLKYNKARQESITTELIEIISGMEALK